MTPEELRVDAARRETVDINAEEDISVLRERCEQLIYAREHLKAKNTELKQMLTEAQVRNDIGILGFYKSLKSSLSKFYEPRHVFADEVII